MIDKYAYLDILAEHHNHLASGLELITDEETLEDFESRSGKFLGMVDNAPYYRFRMDLYRDTQSQRIFRYCNVEYPEKRGAAILPVIYTGGEKRILLERHYRVFLRRFCYEIPRGFSDPKDATNQITAYRELQEETGLNVKQLKVTTRRLGCAVVDSGLSNNTVELFAAEIHTDHVPALEKQDPNEPIQGYRLLSIPEMKDWICQGKIQDSFTLEAFLVYLLLSQNNP